MDEADHFDGEAFYRLESSGTFWKRRSFVGPVIALGKYRSWLNEIRRTGQRVPSGWRKRLQTWEGGQCAVC